MKGKDYMSNFERGKLTVVGGPMFAGKTEELERRVRSLPPQAVIAIKPKLDSRYAHDRIMSHTEAKSGELLAGIAAMVVDETHPELLRLLTMEIQLMAIDEANFFSFQVLQPEIEQVLMRGVNVIAVGLLYDAFKQEFGATYDLLQIADEPLVLEAACYRCGKPAHHTKRLVKTQGQVLVGGSDMYAPSCDSCFDLV